MYLLTVYYFYVHSIPSLWFNTIHCCNNTIMRHNLRVFASIASKFASHLSTPTETIFRP